MNWLIKTGLVIVFLGIIFGFTGTITDYYYPEVGNYLDDFRFWEGVLALLYGGFAIFFIGILKGLKDLGL